MHPPVALRHCGNELILCLPLRASRHSMGMRDLTRCRRERQEANISFLLPWRLRVLACDPQRAAAANGPQPPIRMAGPHHRSVMLPHGRRDISPRGLGGRSGAPVRAWQPTASRGMTHLSQEEQP
jgi:hypothetical protein